MKLLLIEPANRHAALKNRFRVPPLALGILASLTPPNWEIKIIQEPTETINFDIETDFIGISAATNNIKRGYEIAREFRNRGKKVIMGGIHPTIMPNEALRYCDSVCIGEAELIWKDILKDFEKGKLKKTYKQRYLLDLNLYEPPKREMMPLRRPLLFDIGTVETSRGCPYNCNFCSVSSIHGKKIRCRPIKNVISEIESLEKKLLFFVDNNIICNVIHSKKLFQEMIPLKRRWAGQATISIARNLELVKLASNSGCIGLIVGIESVTPAGMREYKKNLKNLSELKEALKILKDNGIGVLATMIFGNDFDTRDTMRASLDNLLELDFGSASLGILVPYPGTEIAQTLEQQNRILSRDWNLYDVNTLVFQPKNFACEEFIEEMQNLRKKYFSFRPFCSRVLSFSRISFPIALGVNIAMNVHNKLNSTPKTIKEIEDSFAKATVD